MTRVGRAGLRSIGWLIGTISIVSYAYPARPARPPSISGEYSDPFAFAREHAEQQMRKNSSARISAQKATPRRRVQKRPFARHHVCEECYKNSSAVCAHRKHKKLPTKKISSSHFPRPRFSWPMVRDRFWISDYYGTKRRGRLHAGIDLAALRGTPVYAAAPGKVEQARSAGGFGNMVLVRHNRQYHSRYAHLCKIATRPGRLVKRGSLIGYVGNSGRVKGRNGDHLHFEILSHYTPVNPIKYLTT